MSCICRYSHTPHTHRHTRTSVMKTFTFYGEAGLNCLGRDRGQNQLECRLVWLSLAQSACLEIGGGIGLYRSDSGVSCQLVSLNRHQNHLANHLSVVGLLFPSPPQHNPPSSSSSSSFSFCLSLLPFTAYQHRHGGTCDAIICLNVMLR